jgi:hypothetical protein
VTRQEDTSLLSSVTRRDASHVVVVIICYS